MNVHQRIRALRKALGQAQHKTSELSGGILTRIDLVRLEGGLNQGSSNRVREGLSKAFGLRIEDLSAYLDEKLELPEVLHRIARGGAKTPPPVPLAPNLRALLNTAEPGTYGDTEIAQAAMFQELKGHDLTTEQWRRYILWLRAASDRIDGEAMMEQAGLESGTKSSVPNAEPSAESEAVDPQRRPSRTNKSKAS